MWNVLQEVIEQKEASNDLGTEIWIKRQLYCNYASYARAVRNGDSQIINVGKHHIWMFALFLSLAHSHAPMKQTPHTLTHLLNCSQSHSTPTNTYTITHSDTHTHTHLLPHIHPCTTTHIFNSFSLNSHTILLTHPFFCQLRTSRTE